MIGNLALFALIGLLVGGAARLFYPGRQFLKILGTLMLGMVGGILGGLISWAYWPEVDGQFSSGALWMSIVGAMVVLVGWAGVAYARSLGDPA